MPIATENPAERRHVAGVNGMSDHVRLYVLDTGLIECADYAMFSPGAEPGTYQVMTVRNYLGLSHLRVDHVGNVGLFPEASVLLQRAEYEAGYGPNAKQLIEALAPDTYAALNRDRIQPVDGDRDLFGDGTVVLTALPGHTPGHQGLLVHLRTAGPILVAGDIAYCTQDYEDEAVRPANVDLEQSRRSIETAKRLERELGATVWLHHDLHAQRAVYTAPRHYQ